MACKHRLLAALSYHKAVRGEVHCRISIRTTQAYNHTEPTLDCAEAFDDLVKEAVRAANAAAQSRADYAVSVVAADMAEACRDRVMSKRGKRRSTSPKTPKHMSWAADEELVQERVFSKVNLLANCQLMLAWSAGHLCTKLAAVEAGCRHL